MRALAALVLLPLVAACSPQNVAEDVTRAAAKSVIQPVIANQFPEPAAEIATGCLLDNATGEELRSLARDVGTRAGTSTVATVLTIAARPAALACLANAGLQPLNPARLP